MQLTQNFTKSEFDSKDGAVMPQEVLKNIKELARNLQVLRDVLGKRITINSGYRSPAYNAQIRGAASNSQHMYGRAADIVVQGIAPEKVAQTIENRTRENETRRFGDV